MNIYNIIFSLLSLVTYALAIYFATILILKYIKKYEKISKLKKHILLLYTAGFASGLQAFLPSLFVIQTNPLLAFYMNYYNVILDFTITLGIMILIAGGSKIMPKEKMDEHFLIVLLLAFILLIVFFIIGKINYIGGIILIILFFIFSSYLYITGKNKENLSESITNIKDNSDWRDIIISSIMLSVSVTVIYVGGLSLNGVSDVLSALGFYVSFIGYIFALVLFTLPNIIYEIISYRKNKNIKISTADIFGEELSEFTIFIGILSLFNPIVFPKTQYLALLSSVIGFSISSFVIYISTYRGNIPRWVGIILILLGFIIGFLNINVIV